jgi:4-hydroxybenzoate polyprenyltransferase
MFKRILIYLNEMFPVTAIVGTIISSLAVQWTYLRIFGIWPTFSVKFLVPGLVITFVSLLIRIMDEFKDYQDDLTNFPDRPLPSGRVLKSDLGILAGFCILMVLFLSSTSMPVFLWGLATLGFTGLMYKWFFIEEVMRKNLPLAFVTHHPIVVFNFIYLILSCIQMYPIIDWSRWDLIIPICFIYTNWEVMRKIRAPKDETTYTTYSKIFGPRKAILMAIALQVAFSLSVVRIFDVLHSPMIIRGVFIGVQSLLTFVSLRFLVTLKLKSPLRNIAEGNILLVLGFLLAASLL